jgi:hypothetical protein
MWGREQGVEQGGEGEGRRKGWGEDMILLSMPIRHDPD